MADLSGYPILRLDHIPLLDNAKLAETETDAGNLLHELSQESPTPPLVFYLRRQMEAIRTELSTRTAKERIQFILNGGEMKVDAVESVTDKPAPVVTPRVAPVVSKPEPAPTFKPLPLPTEIARQRSLSSADENENNKYIPTLLSSKSAASSSTNLFSTPSKETTVPASLTTGFQSMNNNAGTPAKLSSRSTGSEHTRRVDGGIADDQSETSSYFSGGEGGEGRRRRPLEGLAAVGQPSKQAQLVINQRFGSEFIVAATERRKRFYPKKQPTETPEEIKTRERLERRKVAMQRLLERREKNQQELNARKEAKRAQALKKQSSQKTPASEDESSESVSGGENDRPVAVDPKMVENVAQSDISQLTELVASKQKADASAAERSTEPKPASSTKLSAGIGATAKAGGIDVSEKGHNKEATNYDVTSLSSKAKNRISALSTATKDATKSTKGPRKRELAASPSPAGTSELAPTDVSATGTAPVLVSPSVSVPTRKSFTTSSAGSIKVNQSGAIKSSSAPSTAGAAVAVASEKPSTRITPQEREALEALANIQKALKEKDRSRSRTGSITAVVSSSGSAAPSSGAVSDNVDFSKSTDPSGVDASCSTATPAVLSESVQDGVLEGELSTKNNAALMSLRALRAKKEMAKQQSSSDLVVDTTTTESRKEEPSTSAAVIDSIVLSDSSEDESGSPLIKDGVCAEHEETPVEEKEESQCDDADDSFTMSANHPLVAVETPVVFDLDGLLSRSRLLFCLEAEDGSDSEQYSSYFSVGELPGLSAWRLDKTKGAWTVDLFAAASVDSSIEARTSERRKVSRGLLVLMLCCEDLLMALPDSTGGAELFVDRWKACIASFDELAHSLSLQDELYLFESVSVCGNCHAICKKLEHLLRTYFVGDNDGAQLEAENELDGRGSSRMPSRVGTARATLRLDSVSVPASPTRSPDRPVSRRQTTEGSDEVDRSDFEAASSTGLMESASSLEILRAADMLEETIPRDLKVTAIAAAVPAVHANNEDSDSEKESKHVMSVAEILSRQTSTKLERVPSARLERVSSAKSERTPSAPSASVPSATPLDPFTAPQASSAAPTDLRKLKKTASSKATTAAASSDPKPLSLSEYYPHIGLIFPVAYNLMDSSRGGTNDGLTARTLIESMQVQAKVYEEWMEVMSDYSTVFSEERNVNENYGGEGSSAGNAAVYKGGSRSLHYRVKSSRSEVYNIVTDVFNNLLPGWEELPAGLGLGVSWNILWKWSKPRINMTHLLIWQKVNHFHDSKQLTRKDLLKKNLQRFTDMSAPGLGAGGGNGALGGAKISANSYSNSDFEIMPQTFVLPHEYTQFVAAFTAVQMVKEAENLQNYWIMKPVGLSRGRGISLIKDLNELSYSQSSVVQRYIERPLCLSGYKFDLRLFVLVTSFKPLEAFIYRDGFARVSTHAYSLDPESMGNKFIHLTNSSIQKQNLDGPTMDNPLRGGVEAATGTGKASAHRRKASASQQDTDEDKEGGGGECGAAAGGGDVDNDSGGSKIGIQGSNGLWKRLEASGINTAELWRSICTLVVKSLVVADEKMVHQPCCFELFGYDVLIDSDLRPWLLEVNASPSLARENALDTKVKNAMIRDIFHLLDPAPYDRAAVVRVLKRRLNNLAKNKYTMGRNDPDLEKDLKDILGEHVPRRYGEVPKNMGNYEMLCPDTKIFTQVMKLKKKIIKS